MQALDEKDFLNWASGRQVVQTDHHDAIHVQCVDEVRMLPFVEHMAAAGYELPTEPPDWTFKWQPWMRPRSAEGE